MQIRFQKCVGLLVLWSYAVLWIRKPNWIRIQELCGSGSTQVKIDTGRYIRGKRCKTEDKKNHKTKTPLTKNFFWCHYLL